MTINPRKQRSGNHRNIYEMRTCYYLNWECLGWVYRKAFSFRKFGGKDRALNAAVRFRDWMETHRQLIITSVEEIVAHPEDEAKIVRAAIRAAKTCIRPHTHTVTR